MKQLLLLSILFFGASNSFSQLRVGPNASYGWYNIVMSGESNNGFGNGFGQQPSVFKEKAKGGIGFGLEAEYQVGDKFAIELGVRSEKKGYESTGGDSYTEDLNYIMIPLSIKGTATSMYHDEMNFYGEAGFYVGILSSSEVQPQSENLVSFDSKSFHKTTDFGMHASIGGDFPIAEQLVLSPEVGTAIGFTEIFDESAELDNPRPLRNSGIIIGLGVKYVLGS